jgi:DivIVA domain-containing protein
MTTSDSPTDLAPQQEAVESTGFDVVLRGYDRRQVDDYLDRVEIALSESDDRHAADGERITALERQVQSVQEALAEAERRAAGAPEPASLLTARLAQMLHLAEEEAAALRDAARAEAEALITAAKQQAARGEQRARRGAAQARAGGRPCGGDRPSTRPCRRRRTPRRCAPRCRPTRRRSTAPRSRRPGTVRDDARREAEALVVQARRDVQGMHEQARQEAAAMTAEARRQVEELSAQRDADRRPAAGAARRRCRRPVGPLGGTPVQASGGSARVPPRD